MHRGPAQDYNVQATCEYYFFEDLVERFWLKLSRGNFGILCVLRNFRKEKLGQKIRPDSQRGEFLEVPYTFIDSLCFSPVPVFLLRILIRAAAQQTFFNICCAANQFKYINSFMKSLSELWGSLH